ncbi:hypothetical protein MAR_007502 [Mya arenaria]|uniref:Uncharacterized protein n=1 Tax=Mya arenaria TaxID=6604 RepID=A0ABY7DEI5_MYAAR|nr:hypothetical protein MAR_007502 [Mya arenaria]
MKKTFKEMNLAPVIKRVLCPATTFFTVNQFVKRAIQIDKKCRYLTGLDASETRFDGEIVLFFIGIDHTTFLSDLHQSEKIHIDNISQKDYEHALKGRKTNRANKSIFITVTRSDEISTAAQFLDGLIIIGNSDGLKGERLTDSRKCEFIETCTQENLPSTVKKNVERIVLHYMKDAVLKLQRNYDSKRKLPFNHKDASSLRYHQAHNGHATTDIIEYEGNSHDKKAVDNQRKISEVLPSLNESDMSITRSGKRIRCSFDDTERVNENERERALMKDTLHEAFALFSMSYIPRNENPFQLRNAVYRVDRRIYGCGFRNFTLDLRNAVYRVDRRIYGCGFRNFTLDLRNALYRVDRRIYGCGFRNFTLDVFVNIAQRIPTTDERQSLTHRIETTAKEFKIDDVDVNFGRYGQTEMSSCRVGSKIQNNYSAIATLGGFAKSEYKEGDIVSIREHASRSGERHPSGLYVLLSRHFADPENVEFIYLVDSSDTRRPFAKVLKTHNPGIYDIAIASVSSTNITDTQFRDLRGQQRESDLVQLNQMDFASLRSISELEVYFWSAEEEPRIGKVVIPDFDERETNTKLVLLKDIMVYDDDLNAIIPKRMFQKGHSGAIVCYDDESNGRVRVFAMFMGALNYKDIEDKTNGWRIQGEYRSFPVSEGLRQLNEEHGRIFDLC